MENRGINVNKTGKKIKQRLMVEERRHAQKLYLKGCGFRRIARIMSELFEKQYRHQTVFNWIKNAGAKALSKKHNQEPTEIVEMDELYTYINKKT